MTEICRGVAPTSRIAANRCSRRAAASRVAVPMKISTGNSSAPATTREDEGHPVLVDPTWQPWRQSPGDVVMICVTCRAPSGSSSAGVRPTTMSSESGEGSASPPMVPISRPGKRSPSWSAGVRAQQLGERGRDVVLARAGQARDARRYRRVRPGRGDVDPADPVAVEVVVPGRATTAGRRDPSGAAGATARVQPGVPLVLRVDGVDAGEGGQQQADAERDGGGDDDEPDERPPGRRPRRAAGRGGS